MYRPSIQKLEGGVRYVAAAKLIVIETSYKRPYDVSSRRLGPTSWGRLLEFTFLRRHDVDTRRLHDQCVTSLRRRGDEDFFWKVCNVRLSVCLWRSGTVIT